MIKIIIEIPEELRVAITRMGLLRISDKQLQIIDKSIQRGIPFSKEYGRLIDADRLLDEFTELNAISFYEANEHSKEVYYELRNCVKNAPTILESDKESAE